MGAFAGYLSGALAYGSFFVKIENVIFRIIFGGWIGVPLGALLGAIFANYIVIPEIFSDQIDPIVTLVFGGLFFGFWGGTLSGVPAVLALYYFRNDEKITSFFVKLQYYDIQKELVTDLEGYFESHTKELDLNDCVFYQDEVKETNEKSATWFSKIMIILFALNFMVGLLVLTGPTIIRALLFFFNPWEKRNEDKVRESYNELIDYTIKPLGIIREETIVKKT
jgi:hypothetical protein